MARSQNKDSAGSQFFIMTKDTPSLDGQYASFGKVISGMDIIHEIENVETDANDKPVKDVVIESIKVDTKGEKYDDPKNIVTYKIITKRKVSITFLFYILLLGIIFKYFITGIKKYLNERE